MTLILCLWLLKHSLLSVNDHCVNICLLFQVLMAAGDTFRAAASDQLEIWAERTGCEIVVAEKEKAKASSGTHPYLLSSATICFHFHNP